MVHVWLFASRNNLVSFPYRFYIAVMVLRIGLFDATENILH